MAPALNSASDLLGGLIILELASFVAGPMAGLVLAQHGAEVIRIDPVGGGPDANRWPLSADGSSLYWAGLNKGKRSIQVNLRSAAGRNLVHELLVSTGNSGGIVITNSVAQEWVDASSLRKHRPDLIHVHIKGRSDGTSAVDFTVNASVGFPMITGPVSHSAPVNHVLPAWDLACGLYASTGILAAVRRRDRTGEGSSIEIALEDVAVSSAAHLGFLSEAELSGAERPRLGNQLFGAFADDFASVDGQRFMVVALTRRQWASLLEVCEIGPAVSALESGLQISFDSESARYRYREVLAALVQDWFGSLSSQDIEAQLGQANVLWSRFRTFGEVVRDARPLVSEKSLLQQLEQPGVGTHLASTSPIVVDGVRSRLAPAPIQGSDTRDVLRRRLGLDDEEIQGLLADGEIGGLA